MPIVRETGGLKDTVQPYEAWRDAGTGFTFANYSSADMLHVIREAVSLIGTIPPPLPACGGGPWSRISAGTAARGNI